MFQFIVGVVLATCQFAVAQQKISGISFVANRIYLQVPCPNGQSVKLYTDTGGGRVISWQAVQKMGIKPDTSFGKGGKPMHTVNLASYFRQKSLPVPVNTHYVLTSMPQGGLLGAGWFAGKVWYFDYKHHSLGIAPKVAWQKLDPTHIVKLGFQKNKANQPTTHFPRIPIVVDQDTIQVLFDSGATVHLTTQAQKKSGMKSQKMGASFITRSIFEKWRLKHPEWQVLSKGDVIYRQGKKVLEEDLIKVPQVIIGNQRVGPVWFATRKDSNFVRWMSQWMDQKIQGAIGGSCFQYFQTIIVDYQQEQAYFKK